MGIIKKSKEQPDSITCWDCGAAFKEYRTPGDLLLQSTLGKVLCRNCMDTHWAKMVCFGCGQKVNEKDAVHLLGDLYHRGCIPKIDQ